MLTTNGVALDPSKMLATVEGREIVLSRREFAILMALMDEVEARYRHYDGRHGRFAPG